MCVYRYACLWVCVCIDKLINNIFLIVIIMNIFILYISYYNYTYKLLFPSDCDLSSSDFLIFFLKY